VYIFYSEVEFGIGLSQQVLGMLKRGALGYLGVMALLNKLS